MEVIFFPRNDYPDNVEVCAHRYGKSMTYTEHTDSIGEPSYSLVMAAAKSRNIMVSMFANCKQPITSQNLRQDYDNGKIWLDAYAYAPNIGEKQKNKEVITEEEWNEAYNQYILPNFYNFTGKKPVALGYSYGNATFQDYVLPMFLAARGGYYYTDYGVGCGDPNNEPYSFTRYKIKPFTCRWYDWGKGIEKGTNPPQEVADINSFESSLQYVSSKIDETKLNGGWMCNFTHWHHYTEYGHEQWIEPYFTLLAQKNQDNSIHFSGYGEAIAYLVFRQLITKVVMYSPLRDSEKLVIQLESKNTLDIDTDLMQVPITIKFTTENTPLYNQLIKCENRNLISLGNNEYFIEIPYSDFPSAIIEKV